MFQSFLSVTARRAPVRALAVLALLFPAAPAHALEQVEPVLIDSVDVEGNIRQADLTIISMGGLNRGSAYTIFDIQRAFKAMWATQQFEDIRVRVEGDIGDHVTLVWEVDERDLLRNVVITGLTSIDRNQVSDTSGLAAGLPYSPVALTEAKAFIRQELAAKGIPFVKF